MRKLILFLCLPLFAQQTFADVTAPNLPPDMLFNNQPIDPLCIYEAEPNKAVDLKTCGIKAENDRKIMMQNQALIQKGFIGYDFAWPTTDNTEANAFSYYKVVTKTPQGYLLYTINNGGGSGTFTGIYLVKRNNDELKVSNIVSGDRCNGGIEDVTRNKDQLLFEVDITPSDFLDLANYNAKEVKPYDDLAACAACCYGVAKYSIDLSAPKWQLVLKGVDFSKTNLDDVTDQGKYQSCFNDVVRSYQKEGKGVLTTAQLKTFVQSFAEKCVT